VRLTLSRAGINASGSDAAPSGSGRAGPSYPLDIVVNAPDRLFIRGRGLDAELGGALTLTGTSRQVIPAGQFSLIRGRIDILQQRFALDEGSINLQGDFEPFVRLVATTTADDGTVISIVVEGPVSEPVVSFVSAPELPQDEVLARLIFDQPLSEITPFQAVQLAAAVSTLAGRGGGGLINSFREGIGLDDLDITTDDEGGVAVRAGKYLSENVYTDVTVGSDQTQIDLNLDVTDDVTITGRANSDGETGLGIFFERDY
jgi:translocation and assembly module TamB